jgi:two-component system phosphate regulon response regulator PhoB
MAASVLVVEDELAIQELIAVNLESAGFRVRRADDAENALALLGGELPDLVIVDWLLPGMSGLHLARKLRGENRTRQLPIIMVSARSAEQDKIAGLEAGIDDYVTKPFSPRELIARVRALLRRKAPQATDHPVEIAGLRLEPATRCVYAHNVQLEISPTEFQLLRFLMTHPERVHSRTQVLDRVWGDHVFVAERTVDVHMRRLRRALSVSGHDRLLQTVRGFGYRFTAAEGRPSVTDA